MWSVWDHCEKMYWSYSLLDISHIGLPSKCFIRSTHIFKAIASLHIMCTWTCISKDCQHVLEQEAHHSMSGRTWSKHYIRDKWVESLYSLFTPEYHKSKVVSISSSTDSCLHVHAISHYTTNKLTNRQVMRMKKVINITRSIVLKYLQFRLLELILKQFVTIHR